MFDGIAARYDLLNRIMSLGADQRWRRLSVLALRLPSTPTRVLDLATGTADLAIRVAQVHAGTTVVGIDPSGGMLEVARRKVAVAGLSQRIHLLRGAAESLPLRDQIVDGVTMAFGIRNVADRRQGLAETSRVTRSSGRVVILELSEPQGALGLLARFHIRRLVPRLGAMLSGMREYRYLQESIAAFPRPVEFSELMRRAALHVQEIRALALGACHLYVARPAR